MRKLLKFAAPILILALLFASCDDKGKNPGGSTSDGITVQVALPAGIYDGAAWQMSLAARDDAEPIEAKSVSFVPAKDAEGGKALVIGTGFSADEIANMGGSVTVTYTTQSGSVWQATADLSMSDPMSRTLSAEVASGAWASKTPQTITLTVTGQTPANAEGVEAAQLKTTGWTITMAETGKAPISVADFTPTVTTEASYSSSSSSGTAAVVSIAFSAGKNSIPDGTYTATVQYGTGTGMLQGSASSIIVKAGQTNPGAAAVQLNPTNGKIAVTMPATLPIKEDGENVPTSSASISYILTPGSASPVSVPASAIATNAFTISGLEVPSKAGTYSLTVIATYKGADYVVSSESVTGPATEAAEVEIGTDKLTAFTGISLEVTLAVGSNSGLTLSSLPKAGWTVAYTECDSKGNPLAGAAATTFTMPSGSPNSSGQFTIDGLKFNANYLVSATLDTSDTVYSGSGYNATATAAGSSNTINPLQLLITGGAVPFEESGIELAITYGIDSGLSSLSTPTANTLKIGGSFVGAESDAIAITTNITVKGSISASDLGKALPLTGTITQSGSVYTLENSSVTFYQSKTGAISATATITTGDGVTAG